MRVLAPFINGMVPKEVNSIGCMNNLPKSKKFEVNTIYKFHYHENMMSVLAPFVTGMVPTEVNSIGCMINIPKSKNFAVNTIYKCQSVVCKKSSRFLIERLRFQ